MKIDAILLALIAAACLILYRDIVGDCSGTVVPWLFWYDCAGG